MDVPINCGGVLVRPGDLVGCDDDGVIVVPQEHVTTVAEYAVAILLADMEARRTRYERLGLPSDPTVDVEPVASYYRSVGFGPV
jgi:regulator of RNase E activity RraA